MLLFFFLSQNHTTRVTCASDDANSQRAGKLKKLSALGTEYFKLSWLIPRPRFRAAGSRRRDEERRSRRQRDGGTRAAINRRRTVSRKRPAETRVSQTKKQRVLHTGLENKNKTKERKRRKNKVSDLRQHDSSPVPLNISGSSASDPRD